MAQSEEPSVILKCMLADTRDVLRLRTTRPLLAERVKELIVEAIGPELDVEVEDAAGERRPLTDRALADVLGPLLRLHVYGQPPLLTAAVAAAATPPGSSKLQAAAASAPGGQAGASAAAAAKGQRRRQRQQARRKRLRELKAQQPEDPGSVAAGGAVEQPSATEGEEEEDDASEDEGAMARAADVRDGMRVWVESGFTKRLLQASEDGRVDFDGDPEAPPPAFVLRRPAAGAHETAVALQGHEGGFLRRGGRGYLDCRGAAADDPDCRFSFIDVVEGTVLFLGPPGTGHVCAALGPEAPRAGREAAPQAFRLLLAEPPPPRPAPRTEEAASFIGDGGVVSPLAGS